MNFRYLLSNHASNAGLTQRLIKGYVLRPNRWLVSPKKIDFSGFEDLVTEEIEDEKVSFVKVEESSKKNSRTELYELLKSRGFPDNELSGLGKSDLAKLLELDKELEVV